MTGAWRLLHSRFGIPPIPPVASDMAMVLKRLDMVATIYHTGSVADRKVSWGRLEGVPRICDGFSGLDMRFR